MALDPAPIVVPPSLMREQSVLWRIGASTVTPGQTASGGFQIVRLDGGGVWLADWRNVAIRTPNHVRTWRAIAALAENGVMPLVVARCDRRQLPTLIIGGSLVSSYGNLPHSDESLFSDGAGYYQPVILASSVVAAALRADTLILNFATGGVLQGGEIFAIEHAGQSWRMYEIKTVILDGSGNSVITFRPPLREAIDAGTPIEFDNPRCVMRLATPDAMNLELDLRRFGSPSVAFTEYFYPT